MGSVVSSTTEHAAYLGAAIHPQVAAFASEIAAEVGREPVAFLDRLADTLFVRLERGIRPTGEARSIRHRCDLAPISVETMVQCGKAQFGATGRPRDDPCTP